MGSLKIYASLAGFLAVAAPMSVSHAADLLPPPPPPPAEPYSEPSIAGGWYLRGDVGVSSYNGGKIEDYYRNSITEKSYGSGAFAGAGVGYQFNSWFRGDVTGEYRFSTGFNWREKGATSTSTGFYNPGSGVYDLYTANGTSYEKTRTDHSAAVVLVNGYVDLGTWHGITPFVGAGVGWAYHMLRNGDTNTINAYGNYVNAATGMPSSGGPAAGISGGTLRDKDKGNLAWALHAGLAYDVTPNVKLEVGYRYLNMGSVTTGIIDCFCATSVSGTKVKDLEAHEVKIGMRWALGGPASAPSYDAGPLVRKY